MSNVAQELAVDSSDAEAALASSPSAKGARRSGLIFKLAVAWLGLVFGIVLLGWIFGDALPFLRDPDEFDTEALNAGPSWKYPFGNASFGQDVR